MAENKKRTFKVYKNKRWIVTPIENIKTGDIITIFEPDNTTVEHKGSTIYKAFTDSYLGKEGEMTIGVTSIGWKEDKKLK